VWKGTYHGLEVAVKVLKLYECNDQEEIRKVSGRLSLSLVSVWLTVAL